MSGPDSAAQPLGWAAPEKADDHPEPDADADADADQPFGDLADELWVKAVQV